MPSADPAMTAQTLPLRDLHLPAPPGFWPPAPGWWLLALLCVLLALTLFLLLRRHHRLRYQRHALQQLSLLEQDLQLSAPALLAALSTLLRRVMLYAFNHDHCAALNGEAWLQFLDRDFPEAPFSKGIGRCLGAGPYQTGCAFDRAALLAVCRSRLQKLPPVPARRRRS